jgi:competence protein ComEA
MPIIALLVAVIAVGGAVLVYRLTASPHSSEIVISPPSPQITVHVNGEVGNPGVYVLDEDDRVEEAIEAAGGFTSGADETAINLAAPLRDGSRIHVYSLGDVPQKVNINTAESWLLEALPGIGEVLARRIIDYRSENGPFIEIEDLKMVEGIGTATFDKLMDRITVH